MVSTPSSFFSRKTKHKKQEIIIFCILLLLFCLNYYYFFYNNTPITVNNQVDILSNEIELIDHYELRADNYLEINGNIRKIGNIDINYALVTVNFFNINNEVIYSDNYRVYSFVKGYEYHFFVQYKNSDLNYSFYDHYSISLDYV